MAGGANPAASPLQSAPELAQHREARLEDRLGGRAERPSARARETGRGGARGPHGSGRELGGAATHPGGVLEIPEAHSLGDVDQDAERGLGRRAHLLARGADQRVELVLTSTATLAS
jgi:hypothetical protein